MKKWKPKKAAIRVERLYNGVRMQTEYITRSQKLTEDTVNHIRSNMEMYERSRQTKDNLSGPPKLTVTLVNDEQVPGQLTVPVVAVAQYVYETPKGLQKKSGGSIFGAILLFLAAVVVFNIVFFHDLARANDRREMCKIYHRHGIPTHIEVGSQTIDIYGESKEDELTRNPWLKQKLATTKISDCLQIHNKGK